MNNSINSFADYLNEKCEINVSRICICDKFNYIKVNLDGIFIVKNAIYCIVITELPYNENFNEKNFEKKKLNNPLNENSRCKSNFAVLFNKKI